MQREILQHVDDKDSRVEQERQSQIRLANVSNEPALQALATELAARQAELRSAPYVVFDLCGNAGGNSMWGDRFAAIL